MNSFFKEMPADARKLLDDHLDAVERVLTDSGMSRQERRVVCDEVETQACEMAIARAQGEVTFAVMQSVIAELDQPAGYRQQAESSPISSVAFQPTQKLSLFAVGSVIVPIIAVMLLLSSDGALGVLGWLGGVTVISILLSMIALRDIRHSSGRTAGVGFAVFGMLAIPLLVLNFMTYWMSDMLATEWLGGPISKQHQIKLLSNEILVMKAEFAAESQRAAGAVEGNHGPPRLDKIPAIRDLIAQRESDLAALKLTSWEKFVIDAQPMLDVALISLWLTVSGGISVLIYRMTCRYFTKPIAASQLELAY